MHCLLYTIQYTVYNYNVYTVLKCTQLYTPSVIYCPRVLRDIILLVLKDAHVMCSGVADKIQPYRIEIVVASANLKTAYSYILENFHFYISNLGITSNFCGAL